MVLGIDRPIFIPSLDLLTIPQPALSPQPELVYSRLQVSANASVIQSTPIDRIDCDRLKTNLPETGMMLHPCSKSPGGERGRGECRSEPANDAGLGLHELRTGFPSAEGQLGGPHFGKGENDFIAPQSHLQVLMSFLLTWHPPVR